MNAHDRARPVQEKSPSSPSWAESLRDLSLDEARQQTRKHHKASAATRAPWTTHALSDDNWSGVKCVGIFAPRLDWIEPISFNIPPHIPTAYPRMNGERIEFKKAKASELERNGQWKVLEPASGAPSAEPDLLFVPALLMDLQGHRIGRGGGFFDRYLSEHPGTRSVGVIHSDYLMERIPSHWLHSGDQRLNAILTESHYLSSTEENQL